MIWYKKPSPRLKNRVTTLILVSLPVLASPVLKAASSSSLEEEKRALLKTIESRLDYTASQLSALKKLFFASHYLSQGNPEVTQHPVTREQCQARLSKGTEELSAENSKICGSKFMVPLKSSPGQKPTVCIDQFEFPGIPCEYPVVWVRANEAHEICQALGKRLCDAAEWEQGCAGKPGKKDYFFQDKGSISERHRNQRNALNAGREKIWSYGPLENHGKCGTGSKKSRGCDKAISGGGSVFSHCGSNTYPSGYFPECRSPVGVYDIHGNAAEHMNLPLSPEEKTIAGGTGVVEMKGSWFIFSAFPAHPDDCFWRAPYWHGTPLANPKSHHNYHLGFRCCKSIPD